MTPEQAAWRAAHHVPWSARIGEGGPQEWAVVVAYLVAAALCVTTARRVVSPGSLSERRLWWMTGLAMLLLGLNKQLDFQILLFETGREIALAQGWYGARRLVQAAAFVAGVAVAAAGAFWLLPMAWRAGAAFRVACAGMALIATYVALRAAKFQHLLWDVRGFDGPAWVPALELAGVLIVAGAAGWRWRRGT